MTLKKVYEHPENDDHTLKTLLNQTESWKTLDDEDCPKVFDVAGVVAFLCGLESIGTTILINGYRL